MIKTFGYILLLLTIFGSGCQAVTDKMKSSATSAAKETANNSRAGDVATVSNTDAATVSNVDDEKKPVDISSETQTAAKMGEKDLLSFFSGALIVKKTKDYGGGWTAENAIDENPGAGWASPKGEITDHSFVIELPEKTLLKSLSFDTAATDGEKRGAQDITVEISDVNPDTGFQEIARVSLKDKTDNQRFNVVRELAGRFVRISFGKNQGSTEYVELMEIRGYGEQLTKTPLANASGTYTTTYGDFHIKQEGTSVIGCYEYKGGLLKGGLEDRVMTLNWSEESKDEGPAVMVFTADGQKMIGLWWHKGDNILATAGSEWNGTKKSSEIGSCPNLPNLGKANAAQNQITTDLKQTGRARVYGINFDTGSDAIKPESKTVLGEIMALLKENAGWKMTIEGHTDNVGGADYNQKLSEKRAAAVKAYLVAAGIETTRLSSAGFGMSKPIETNESAPGRAQNRRVELVKN